jgi:hypothetical protein
MPWGLYTLSIRGPRGKGKMDFIHWKIYPTRDANRDKELSWRREGKAISQYNIFMKNFLFLLKSCENWRCMGFS